MKKVILVANSLFKYRAHIYADFIELFKNEGIDFKVVISTKWKQENFGMPESNITFVGASFLK